MKAMALVFSNVNDGNLPELTFNRTMGSVPFGGRYRLIDFVLSNFVNSDVTKIGVITKTNYQSLMDHVGTGKSWDLDRKTGGLRLLPPFGTKSSDLYISRIDALRGALNYLSKSSEEYVFLSDCDVVMNFDFKELLNYHIEKNADITLVYKHLDLSKDEAKHTIDIDVDESGRVTGIQTDTYVEGIANKYLKVLVMRRGALQYLISDALSRGKQNFEFDILGTAINDFAVYGYEYNGYYACLDSLQNYYKYSMGLLDKENRDLLFNAPDRQIYTKVKDSPPTKYGNDCRVVNSLVADGCIIEGEVENSILFRGTKVGKGAKVKNCIIMQDSIIGEKAELNAVITDKNVIIRDKIILSGHPLLPFYIGKGKVL